MSPGTKRIVVPLIVTAFAALIVGSMVFNLGRTPPPSDDIGQIADADEAANSGEVEGQSTDNTTDDDDGSSDQQPLDDDSLADQAGAEPDEGVQAGGDDDAAGADADTDTNAGTSPAPTTLLTGLRAVAPDRDPTVTPPTPQALGSLDPNDARLKAEFSLSGAGLSRITLSDYWQVWSATRQAERHYKAVRDGSLSPPPLPPDDQRYVLQTDQPLWWTDPKTKTRRMMTISVLAADAVIINDQTVRLLSADAWTERAPGQFETTLLNDAGETIARITRTFVLDGFELELLQRLENLTTQPLNVEWIQYGPGDLRVDRSRYMDRRRYRFGYLPDAVNSPTFVTAEDNDLLIERQKVIKNDGKGRRTLWPNDTSVDEGYTFSWFASTNRYFSLAVHPLLGGDPQAPRDLEHVFDRILTRVSILPPSARTNNGDDEIVFTVLRSPVQTVAPNQSVSFDLGAYAGPLDRAVLDDTEPFAALKMKQMILYQMSSFCAICTFQWLANFLMFFLTFVDGIALNWAVAIIILVVIVRTLLHPLTKRAQINMQRFSKRMSAMKPDIDRIQKKYKDDPKKAQQEQMKLWKEHGVNPLQALGCLPMFLQMPIWVALYAMLYFAIELRHEPAFWGVFQLIGNWPFLADLSSADHFFWEFQQPHNFLMWNITGINIMPLLLGAVFFVQQKYMSPPPSPTMTKDQINQQKIMKVMMVVLFPIMLYSAPSGLTLYIFTSSLIGIIESRYVRKHIKELDLQPKKKPAKPKKKPKDPQARAYIDAMDRAKRKSQPQGNPYKKRR